MNNLFEQMLSRYEIHSNDDYKNAIHEVMQQVTLAGLYRGNFFDKAAFYGGTCLRMFHGLQRFSEDMDFSLLQSNQDFSLEEYFNPILNEFKAVGREVKITRREKNKKTNIESAFLKDDTAIYNLQFKTEGHIKIKIEVDINPPLGFDTENKLLLLPFSFMPRCYTLPNLYAGKIHALLFRAWKNRVKGRDWYDFEWYVRNGVTLNFEHFCQRAGQSSPVTKNELTHESFKQLLREKISRTDMNLVKSDVLPFIKKPQDIEIWSNDYFLQLVDMIRF